MIETITYENVIGGELNVSLMKQRLRVYVYAIDGLLVDTGPSRLRSQLIPFFRQLSLQQVALTHYHEDHTGLAPWLGQDQGLPVYIHEQGMDLCRSHAVLPLYRRLFWGARHAFEPLPIPQQIETQKHSLQVIYTPGHSHDHVVLLDVEHGRLFSGDLYLASRPKTMMPHESVKQIMQSLETVLAHDFDTVFCCHAGVVQDGKRLLAQKLDYLQNVQGEVLHLYRQGMTAKAISKKLYPRRYPIVYFSGNEISPVHIINSILEER